jgi:hypothetical protein
MEPGASAPAAAAPAPPVEPPRPRLCRRRRRAAVAGFHCGSGGTCAAPAVTRRGGLQGFVESVVAPHTVPAENPDLPRLRTLVDAEAGRAHAGLAAPLCVSGSGGGVAGVFHLVRAIETGSQLKLYLLDVSKAELAADLSAADDLRESQALAHSWWTRPWGRAG